MSAESPKHMTGRKPAFIRDGRGRAVRSINTAKLDAAAAELRAGGATFAEISEVQKCSLSTAHQRVSRAIEAVPVAAVLLLRQREGAKLDLAEESVLQVMEAAADGDRPNPDRLLRAVDRILSISERRCALFGLDVPARQRIQVTTDEDVANLIEAMKAEQRNLETMRAGYEDVSDAEVVRDEPPELPLGDSGTSGTTQAKRGWGAVQGSACRQAAHRGWGSREASTQ